MKPAVQNVCVVTNTASNGGNVVFRKRLGSVTRPTQRVQIGPVITAAVCKTHLVIHFEAGRKKLTAHGTAPLLFGSNKALQ